MERRHYYYYYDFCGSAMVDGYFLQQAIRTVGVRLATSVLAGSRPRSRCLQIAIAQFRRRRRRRAVASATAVAVI